MTNRRPPDDSPDSTALFERPDMSRSDGGDTDPNRRRPQRDDDATGRHVFNELDELRPSALPSAWVSEFEVSDLDGDVVGPGAATTIMQLPPEMQAHEPPSELHAVDLMKWRAGPSGAPTPTAPPTAAPTGPATLPPTPASPDPTNGTAATLPALSLDLVRAVTAGVAAAAPPGPLPHAHHTVGHDDDDEEDTQGGFFLSPSDRLRATLEQTMGALLAAQSCADGGDVPDDLHGHLARAIQLLSTAQDLSDDL